MRNWRDSKCLALGELAVVALIVVSEAQWHWVPVSETPLLLVLGWISLWLRRVGWRGVGFARRRTWMKTLALGVGTGLLMEAFQLSISQPVLVWLTGKQPDLHQFQRLTGNLKLALIGLAVVWTLAAFGEEMVWRGYLMNRAADLGNGTRRAWICSLLVVSIAFGFGHAHQGVTGVIDEGLMGLLLGFVYLRTDRNLIVPVVAHGVQDTVDLLLMFFGKYPGM